MFRTVAITHSMFSNSTMTKVNPNLVLMAFLAVSTAINQASAPCLAASKGHNFLEQTLVIKASPKVVFEGIQRSRTADPERRHLVSQQQDVAIIDEKIPDLPVIGTAHLVYKEIEVPFKRIDYLLVSSDKFKAFEGSWELTPLENGEGTKVILKSYSDLKVWVPFAKDLSASSTVKDINRRLCSLQRWCDQKESREETARQETGSGGNFVRSHSTTSLAENHLHSKVHADIEEAIRVGKQGE
jgi:hypothetical protein